MELKIVLIEDEKLALDRLKRLLSQLAISVEILAEIRNVKDGMAWFAENEASKIDLIIADIQLTDGISFEIFEKTNLAVPIIFATAYDEYMLKAFKTYGIEYLLKPFSSKELDSAIQKYQTIVQGKKDKELPQGIDRRFFKHLQQSFPTFISYLKEKIIPVKSEEIVYFSLVNQVVYAYAEDRKWALNETLNQIMERLPDDQFYRANRQCIIQRKYIDEIESYFAGKLKVKLKLKQQEEILISKDNGKSFKDWLQKS